MSELFLLDNKHPNHNFFASLAPGMAASLHTGLHTALLSNANFNNNDNNKKPVCGVLMPSLSFATVVPVPTLLQACVCLMLFFILGSFLSLTPLGSLWKPGLQRNTVPRSQSTLVISEEPCFLLYNHNKDKGNGGVCTGSGMPHCCGFFAGHLSFCAYCFISSFAVRFEVPFMHTCDKLYILETWVLPSWSLIFDFKIDSLYRVSDTKSALSNSAPSKPDKPTKCNVMLCVLKTASLASFFHCYTDALLAFMAHYSRQMKYAHSGSR